RQHQQVAHLLRHQPKMSEEDEVKERVVNDQLLGGQHRPEWGQGFAPQGEQVEDENGPLADAKLEEPYPVPARAEPRCLRVHSDQGGLFNRDQDGGEAGGVGDEGVGCWSASLGGRFPEGALSVLTVLTTHVEYLRVRWVRTVRTVRTSCGGRRARVGG